MKAYYYRKNEGCGCGGADNLDQFEIEDQVVVENQGGEVPVDDTGPFLQRLLRQIKRVRKAKANPRRVRKNFKWITSDGDALSPKDMATPHLFYALRMIWNNTVPPVFRIGMFRRRSAVGTWPIDYVVQAVDELRKELNTRDDLDTDVSDTPGDTIREQLDDLGFNSVVFQALKDSGSLDSVGK
jgi:hypothetical protein